MTLYLGAVQHTPAQYSPPKHIEARRTTVRSSDTPKGFTIVAISGAVDSHAAGQVYDTLVQHILEGRTRLIVDLSGVNRITRAGVRGLIVAAKLVTPGRGGIRICGARKPVVSFLRGLGLPYLIKLDPTPEISITELYDGSPGTIPAPTISPRFSEQTNVRKEIQ
jgi:anti-anti-sigma factor